MNINNGLVFLDKEKGKTCRQIDNEMMKLFNCRHVGHLGTLDPFATGLLIIGVGEGTKLLSIFEESSKTYQAVLKLGIKTDTADYTGNIIRKDENVIMPCLNEINNLFTSLLGNSYQVPPKYSAKKINGVPAYKLAHKNIDVDLKPQLISISSITINSIDEKEKTIDFSCTVSKGTYIRTLGETIAEKLNTCGHLKELRRTHINNISINSNFISCKDDIKLVPLLECFDIMNIKTVALNERFVGQQLIKDIEDDCFIAVDINKKPLAIYMRNNDRIFKVKRGFAND